MYDSIDDESAPLTPREEGLNFGRSRNKENRKTMSSSESPNGLMINRIMILLTLAGLVAVSIYLNSFHKQMTHQLATDEERIHRLEKTIELQEIIIERFNQSITNTDILKKLDAMEKEWNDERVDLLKQLQDTQADVTKELDATMRTLDETVHKAEADIHDQVDSMKADFEQYVLHTEDQFSMENSFMVYQLAGTFTLLSCLISMWHMGSHMRKMNQPVVSYHHHKKLCSFRLPRCSIFVFRFHHNQIQRKILAILWMCPIYVRPNRNWFA
jgi:uncharacterized coiled-coil protein SlyX